MRHLSATIKTVANKLGIQFPTPLPLFLGSPNSSHLADWAESQITPIARKIAQKMVDNLQYIPFEAFLKPLQKTIHNFHEKLNDEPYVLLLGEFKPDKLKRGCSDQWMIGLALEYCGLKEPEIILTPDQLKSWQSTHPTVTNLLMLDDASYSGQQKKDILEYFVNRKNELKSHELSFYVGIPFMTHYAENQLSAMRLTFKNLIVLDHAYMPSTAEILDPKEIFYAEQTNIGYISHRQTLTYFDHRFADFYSCFQQIYDGSNLLMAESVHMMRFLGYTFESQFAKKNKHLQLITDVDQYNTIAISLTDPNSWIPCSGYAIPTIIPPYQLHQYEGQENLEFAIKKIGTRNSYPANDPKIDAILTKPIPQNIGFFRYKKSELSLEKQMAYDNAVMLGNQNEITYDDQIDMHKKHHQLTQELETHFPILKPLKTELRHPFLQYIIDTLVQIFNLFTAITGLRMLLTMFQEAICCNTHKSRRPLSLS
jgi:hypothetical protein